VGLLKVKKNLAKQGIYKLLIAQALLVLIIAGIAIVTLSKSAALSAILGGIVAIVPSLLFALKLFRHSGARAAREIVRGFYIGEALKIASSIALFTIVFIYYKVEPLIFFVTYIAVVMTHWFSPLIIDNQRKRPESD